MKIKQFAAVIISICGLNVGIAKSVAVEMKAPFLDQQSGKIEELETSDIREKTGVTKPPIQEFQNFFPYKVADRDRGGNPDSSSTSGGG
ncbi:MAG: hypothetical protein AB4080_26130, partial [Trichodesmium sp.]